MRIPKEVNGLSVPKAALAWIEAGVPIAPFDNKRGNGKECGNIIGPWDDSPWYERITTDKQQLREWRSRYGRTFPALATSPGEFGCIVLDLDKPDLWPEHLRGLLKDQRVPFVATRLSEHKRRGHYWFTSPASAMSNRGFIWGDVRASGGGLVLPPYTNTQTGDVRTVVREGSPPSLPEELLSYIAGAVCVDALNRVDLQEFLNRHSDETRPYKLKGLQGIFHKELARWGSRHLAAREALKTGFCEARLGYVTAQHVYDSIHFYWDKSRYEYDRLAEWCCSVAESRSLEEIKDQSDRGRMSDSRKPFVSPPVSEAETG